MDVNWLEFEESLKYKNYDKCIIFLEKYSRKTRGTPSNSIKTQSINMICASQSENEILKTAIAFHTIYTPTSLELAAHLFSKAYKVDPDYINHHLLSIAALDHWEVREWVAGACGNILKDHFHDFYKLLKSDWVHHEDENVRRAVVVAVKYVSILKVEEYKQLIFQLIEKLLYDSSSYVKKNLGPFAIGDGLLKHYPEYTLKMLKVWAEVDNEHVKWNVVKAFSSAEAKKYQSIGGPVLKALTNDQSKNVQRAARTALKKLEKHRLHN